ncbi:putative Proteasome subunit beta type-7 [Blattamonas nauphoetae]|uniref:Proteasome subunit beta n=1 Tax=Blattamonas nauphoetae TaxID=2049346 RepID=A0ABQ9Y3V9_9EUKA|nr:putative Proteasome subunit beta type-7 [Blattamonas nauphoetae]
MDPAKSIKGTKKTGTTICGVVFKGGVVLGADSKATGGHIVMDKSCMKIHKMTPSIYCGGAGTAADTHHVTAMIGSQLRLLELNTGRPVRVETACVKLKRHLFPYQGYVGAHLILGGCDFTGPHLYNVSNHGSVSPEDFSVMGSGSYAAVGVMESKYKPDMTEEEAINLTIEAITAGIIHDEGSGFYVNYTVIRHVKESPYAEVSHGYHVSRPAPRQKKIKGLFTIPRGETEIMKEIVVDFATQTSEITIDKPHNTPIKPVGYMQ